MDEVFTSVTTPTNPRSAAVPSTSDVKAFAIRVPEVLPEIATAATP